MCVEELLLCVQVNIWLMDLGCGGAEVWLWAPAVMYILILVGVCFGAEC